MFDIMSADKPIEIKKLNRLCLVSVKKICLSISCSSFILLRNIVKSVISVEVPKYDNVMCLT